MISENNKAVVREFMERAFNQGDLSAVDEHLASDGIDHQEPLGTEFRGHLKQVVSMLRIAFPDLHYTSLSQNIQVSYLRQVGTGR